MPPNSDPFAQARNAYMDVINTAVNRDFIASENLADKLDIPYFASLDWSGIVFREGASPHDVDIVRGSFHVAMSDTFDLIRYEYEVKGLAITILESAIFIYTEIKSQTGQSANLEQAAEWAGEIYKIPDKTEFKYINARDGVFSNSPNRDLSEMASWSDRIDGVIKPTGAVGFLIYKVHTDFDDIYKDPSTWFPDEVRGI